MEKKVNLKSRFRPQHRKLSLYLSIGVMGICMLAFSAWTPASVKTGAASDSEQHLNSEHIPGTSAGNTADTTPSDSDSTVEQSPENAPGSNEQKVPDSPTGIELPPATPTPSPSPTPVPNPLLTNAHPEINTLVETYYNAKLTGEPADFEALVSDTSAIDTDYLHIQYELVTDFSNFTCYTKNGINEIAYIVYVSYDSKIVTIDTPVPSLDRITLVYAPDGSGKLLINTSELSDEISTYCDELFSHEDVQLMYQQESKRFEDAVASDPDLQQLQNRLDTEKDAN